MNITKKQEEYMELITKTSDHKRENLILMIKNISPPANRTHFLRRMFTELQKEKVSSMPVEEPKKRETREVEPHAPEPKENVNRKIFRLAPETKPYDFLTELPHFQKTMKMFLKNGNPLEMVDLSDFEKLYGKETRKFLEQQARFIQSLMLARNDQVEKLVKEQGGACPICEEKLDFFENENQPILVVFRRVKSLTRGNPLVICHGNCYLYESESLLSEFLPE